MGGDRRGSVRLRSPGAAKEPPNIRRELRAKVKSDKQAPREFETKTMKPAFTDELTPSADDLLFFIDDVGHEAFAGDQDY